MRNDVPLYRQSLAFAKSVSDAEVEACRASHTMNVACRNAIESAIMEYNDGYRLNIAGAKSVVEAFGFERVKWVLSNTLQKQGWDGRYSRENRRWANQTAIPDDWVGWYDWRDTLIVRSHPAVLNGFVNQVQRLEETMQQEHEAPEEAAELTMGGL